jgi:predicted RNase H-like HicB family nuclease
MKKVTVLKYNVVLYKEDKYYIADVPTLGISDFGTTVEKAKKNVQGAIECHVEGLAKLGEKVPPPDEQEFFSVSQASIRPTN